MYKYALILGAGASAEYGFPTGTDLTNHILAFLGKPEGREALDNVLHTGPQHMADFRYSFHAARTRSIDQFLQINNRFDSIGRTCISYVIGKREIESVLESSENRNKVYDAIWHKLIETVRGPEDLFKNDIAVITFNYDRSLEWFIFKRVQNLFHNMFEHECFEIMKRFKVVHIYGQNGFLPWDKEEPKRAYNHEISVKTAFEVKNVLKIIDGEREPLQKANEARKILVAAENILFLGFGYDPNNMKLLYDQKIKTRNIYGTFINRLSQTDDRIKTKDFPLFIRRTHIQPDSTDPNEATTLADFLNYKGFV